MRAASPAPARNARSAALHLLSRRDYTTTELRRKLLDRDYAASDIDEALAKLTAAKLLDDRRVAAAHVRTAASIKGRGRLRIQRELETRGIERGLIRELLSALPADDEARAIQRALARARLPRVLDAAGRRRVFQQLIRRGFPVDAISKALRARGLDTDAPDSDDDA